MYAYLSEHEKFKDFNDSSALYWFLKDIEYGNWNIGDNNDGTFSYSHNFDTTPVK